MLQLQRTPRSDFFLKIASPYEFPPLTVCSTLPIFLIVSVKGVHEITNLTSIIYAPKWLVHNHLGIMPLGWKGKRSY